MKTLESSYASFCDLVQDQANLSLSYEELCFKVKVSPVDLNEILTEELGYTGEELIAALRALPQRN